MTIFPLIAAFCFFVSFARTNCSDIVAYLGRDGTVSFVPAPLSDTATLATAAVKTEGGGMKRGKRVTISKRKQAELADDSVIQVENVESKPPAKRRRETKKALNVRWDETVTLALATKTQTTASKTKTTRQQPIFNLKLSSIAPASGVTIAEQSTDSLLFGFIECAPSVSTAHCASLQGQIKFAVTLLTSFESADDAAHFQNTLTMIGAQATDNIKNACIVGRSGDGKRWSWFMVGNRWSSIGTSSGSSTSSSAFTSTAHYNGFSMLSANSPTVEACAVVPREYQDRLYGMSTAACKDTLRASALESIIGSFE